MSKKGRRKIAWLSTERASALAKYGGTLHVHVSGFVLLPVLCMHTSLAIVLMHKTNTRICRYAWILNTIQYETRLYFVQKKKCGALYVQ